MAYYNTPGFDAVRQATTRLIWMCFGSNACRKGYTVNTTWYLNCCWKFRLLKFPVKKEKKQVG